MVPRKPIDFFGDDSPLFAKKEAAPKKKVVKKKAPIRRKRKVDVNDLFSKTEVAKPKKRGPKSKAELEEESIVAENKRIAARRKARAKKTSSKPTKTYPKVSSPKDCKNILPAFKKSLDARWKMLDGTHNEASTVASYISGVMSVCREKRPKEYDELYVLRLVAKKICNERD